MGEEVAALRLDSSAWFEERCRAAASAARMRPRILHASVHTEDEAGFTFWPLAAP
jgi:hypothetical protein